MKSFRLSIWQQWLLHAFVLWLVLELNDALAYLYDVYTGGAYTLNPDGTTPSLGQRFLHHTITQGLGLLVLAGTLPLELNYHLVFKKKPFRYFLTVTAGTALVFVLLLSYYRQWTKGGFGEIWTPTLVMAGYGCGYALLRNFIHQQILRSQQQQEQMKAELKALRTQVNPHFLFNTLNTLYGLALTEHARQTARSIEQLASIMRYTLTEATYDFTTVANEFTFVQDYWQLQQQRLPARDTLQLTTDLHYDQQPAQIPPLLLIPFIENAFKYGIRMDQPCFVSLQLRVEHQQLSFRIENSTFPGLSSPAGLGTGIENTRKRLAFHYPNKHHLTIQQANGTYLVNLHIDLH